MKRLQFNILIFDLAKSILGKNISKYLHFQTKRRKLLKALAIFIHMPKAAGTSVSDVLYGERIGHYTLDYYLTYLGKKHLEEKFCFSVVHDPFQRLVSAWRYARSGGTSEGGVRNPAYYFLKPSPKTRTVINRDHLNWGLNEEVKIYRESDHSGS